MSSRQEADPIDLTGLSFFGSGPAGGSNIDSAVGQIITGPTPDVPFTVYSGSIAGPTSFGSGGLTFANSGSGDIVGITGISDALVVPLGYDFGSALSDTSTYTGATFNSLGVTPGTYVWTWGEGEN